MAANNRKSQWLILASMAIVLLSVYLAFATYPSVGSCLLAAIALATFVALFLPVGWIVPCAFGGMYLVTLFVINIYAEAGVALGSTAMVMGTALGLVIGFMIDRLKRSAPESGSAPEQGGDIEPSNTPRNGSLS